MYVHLSETLIRINSKVGITLARDLNYPNFSALTFVI